MVSSHAETVEQYLAELPDERRGEVSKVRKIILDHLPDGYEEVMQYGMISYVVPLSKFPDTYNKQAMTIASLASQKNYISLYLMAVYGDKELEAWFKEEYQKSRKKLNMGKSCLRFKKVEDIPLDLIGKVIGKVSVDKYIAKVKELKGKGIEG